MQRAVLISVSIVALAAFAMAQDYSPAIDILGAHLNYGRGCAACHAPHSGARGNGIANSDTTTGDIALWGQAVLPCSAKPSSLARASTEAIPRLCRLPGTVQLLTQPGILTCLSCHDGNWAKGATMQNKVYEAVPSNQHPDPARQRRQRYRRLPQRPPGGIECCHWLRRNLRLGLHHRQCRGTWPAGTKINKFVTANYGWFVRPAAFNGQPTVMCNTCHNQHIMNVYKVGNGNGLGAGTYQTMFFVRGPYSPSSTTENANGTAQFCRQCHGGEANEMNNGTAGMTL